MRRAVMLGVALLQGLFFLSSISAAAPPRAGWSKVLVWPAKPGDRVSAATLASLGAERIRDYEAFSLVRVPTSSAVDAASRAAENGLRLDIEDDWDRLLMPGATVDTRDPVLPSGGLIDGYPAGEGLFVVQFDGPDTTAMLNDLASRGLTYVEDVPYNGVVVLGRASDVAKLSARPGVQWTSIYHPAFRNQPKTLAPEREVRKILVQLVNMPRNQATLERLRAATLAPESTNSYGPYLNVVIEATSAIIPALLADPYVVGIEYPGVPCTSGEREAIAVTTLAWSGSEPWQDGTSPHKPAGDYRTWLSNRSVLDTSAYRIAFCDTGLASYHQDITPGRDIGYLSYVSGGATFDFKGHGTAVVGMAVGDPTGTSYPGWVDGPSGGFLWGMGLAPKSKVLSQRIFDNGGGPYYPPRTFANDAYNWGCTAQTHSWNEYYEYGPQGGPGLYSALAQEYDFAVRDTYGGEPFTPMPITISAGNICGGGSTDCSTMVLAGATAKNVLAVGATESYRPGLVFDDCSSRWPCDRQADGYWSVAGVSRRGTVDGRFKPDIVAPATLVSSAQEPNSSWCIWNPEGNGSRNYFIDSGTSFAAPQAAAAYVLLTRRRFVDTGGQVTSLSPAMLKAAVVGTALSVKGGMQRGIPLPPEPPPGDPKPVGPDGVVAPRPNSVQGFGRLYLGEALASPGPGRTHTYLDESSWTPFTGAGQTRSRTFTVADMSKATVIVLAWTDPPASAGAQVALKRDLDLWYQRPVSPTWYYTGNQMNSDEWSRQQTSPVTYDNRNNVEMIVIQPGTLSSFTMNITTRTFTGTPAWQSFAIFASNAS